MTSHGNPRLWSLVTLFSLAGFMAGCGNEVQLWPVNGKVVFADGAPVSGGIIEFAPKEVGPSARAALKSDGSFTLTTGERPGAVAGVHRIALIQSAAPMDIAPGSHKHAKVRSVPAKYGRFDTSGLEQRVEPGSNEGLTIRIDAP